MNMKRVLACSVASLLSFLITCPIFASEGVEYVKKTYQEYLQENSGKPLGGANILINAAEYTNASEDADVQVVSNFMGMQGDTITTSDVGYVEWSFDVQEPGMYNIEALYYPIEGRSNTIERILTIDGETPFQEASYVLFSRVWTNAEPIRRDGRDNDVRPQQKEMPMWRTQQFYDSLGYMNTPLLYYFEKGKHILRLEASREPIALHSIRIYNVPVNKTYAQIKEEYAQKGYKEATGEIIKVQAEDAYIKSDFTIYPINDRSSAITEPQDSAKVRLNSIGGAKWKLPHQWITWKVSVPKDGLYKIAMRFKQDVSAGVYTNRRLMIDNEVPFAEAESVKFAYSTEWGVDALGNDNEDYLFYLTEGEHEITLSVMLGDLSDIVNKASQVILQLNQIYRNILMITGPEPDLNRDYFFDKLIAADLKNMKVQKEILEEISNTMQVMSGGKGEKMVIVDKLIFQLEQMYNEPEDIAQYFKSFKDNIGTFATWNLTMVEQPLNLDYIAVAPVDAKLPRAEGNLFESFSFNVMSFLRSFFEDYNTLGSTLTDDEMKNTEMLEVWIATGRDQMQIVRDMINDSFTPETNINVNLKLVAKETLLPSVLAGIGPDVALSNPQGDAVQYAVRNAVIPLNDMPDIDEVLKRFHPTSLVPYELEGSLYALPETQTFPMLFYRKDVFSELGLEVPNTWEDFYRMITELQKKNMQTGFPADIMGLQIFLYQKQGELYNAERSATTLDSDLTVSAFQRLTELFTTYKLPRDVDFANRFRTGEMPVGIYSYDFYNTIIAFAPEIKGMWSFVPLPGTVLENDFVNHTSPAGGTSVMMLRGAENTQEAWQFMKWYTSEESQSRFGHEMQAILGPSAKQATANMKAIENMPWTKEEYANLMAQWEYIQGTPEIPGSYYMTRAVDFAAAAAYNDGNPEAILDQVKMANSEIKRKRIEFGLEKE